MADYNQMQVNPIFDLYTTLRGNLLQALASCRFTFLLMNDSLVNG
ncbi:MAG: hypothetical protein QM771_03555 [Nitrospira sp.]